jgi:hypothetical protein
MRARHLAADRRPVADMVFGLSRGELLGLRLKTRDCKQTKTEYNNDCNRFIAISSTCRAIRCLAVLGRTYRAALNRFRLVGRVARRVLFEPIGELQQRS